MEDLTSKIESLIISCAGTACLEIVELNVRRQNKAVLFDIMVDREQGGIMIEECSLLNKIIVNAIEEQGLIGELYGIEVSSPGCDRPLRTVKDFRRNIGKEIEFYLSEEVKDKKYWVGTLKNVSESEVVIETKTENLNIPLTIIDKALQVLPL